MFTTHEVFATVAEGLSQIHSPERKGYGLDSDMESSRISSQCQTPQARGHSADPKRRSASIVFDSQEISNIYGQSAMGFHKDRRVSVYMQSRQQTIEKEKSTNRSMR